MVEAGRPCPRYQRSTAATPIEPGAGEYPQSGRILRTGIPRERRQRRLWKQELGNPVG